MQQSIKRQRGLGWFGLLFVFGTIAFFALIAIKVGPLYLNHGTIVRVVKTVAKDSGSAEVGEIRRSLERRWDIDYISQIDDKDIKVKRTPKGRALAYDYEARVNLFYNVFVVVHFKGEHLMSGSAASDV
tara:strand:- start:31855 stop:32241 length:387 start_codon:yes stop_codon:yes gene_type:complete